MIVAGIGCRKGCSGDEIVTTVRTALARAAVADDQLSALATASFKASEGGMRAAAMTLGLPLLLIDDIALKAVEPRCMTRSETSRTVTGLVSVAESAALAAAGDGALLILPRIAGAASTCALAEVVVP